MIGQSLFRWGGQQMVSCWANSDTYFAHFPEASFFADNSRSVSSAYTFPGTHISTAFCEWESRHVLFCYCLAKPQLNAAHSRLFLSTLRNRAWPFHCTFVHQYHVHCTSPPSYCVALLYLPVCQNTCLAVNHHHPDFSHSFHSWDDTNIKWPLTYVTTP